jgi:nuclease-like protein
MSFRLYMSMAFNSRHENRQFERIERLLYDRYRKGKRYVCCMANVPFTDNARRVERDIDILVIERSTISIIELKSKTGRLSGTVAGHHASDPLLLEYADGETEHISMEQVQAQRKYVRNLITADVARHFDLNIDKPVNLDSYLVFNDGTDLSDLEVDSEIAGQWFIPTTMCEFGHQFFSRSVRNHLKLQDNQITWIAERHLGLAQADPVKFWTRMKSTKALLNDLIADLEDTYDGEHTADLLRDALASAVDAEAVDAAVSYAHDRHRTVGIPDDERLREFVQTSKLINKKHKTPGLVDRLFAHKVAEFLVHVNRSLVHEYLDLRENPDKDIGAMSDILWTIGQQYLDLLTSYQGIKRDLEYEAPDFETGPAIARMMHGSAAIRALAYDWRRATEPFKEAE